MSETTLRLKLATRDFYECQIYHCTREENKLRNSLNLVVAEKKALSKKLADLNKELEKECATKQ